MRRRVENLNDEFTTHVDEVRAAAESVDKAVGGPKKAKPKRGFDKSRIYGLVSEMRQKSKKELASVTPSQLVALYYLCHWDIYGSEPLELRGETWKRATMAAGKLIKEQFKGRSKEAVEFLRWTWRRERYRVNKNQDGATRRRLTWRHQFVWKDLLSDYCMEMAEYRKALGK